MLCNGVPFVLGEGKIDVFRTLETLQSRPPLPPFFLSLKETEKQIIKGKINYIRRREIIKPHQINIFLLYGSANMYTNSLLTNINSLTNKKTKPSLNIYIHE